MNETDNTEETEETGITLETVASSLKEKVRKVIFDALPDEALEDLIRKEFDAMFKERNVRVNTYSQERKIVPSAMSEIINDELKKLIKNRVDNTLKEGFTTWYDNMGEPVMTEAITKIVVESSPAIMQKYFERIALSALQGITPQQY